ncbi:hypothetical protein HYW60_00860 [Candidatus Kaiserbacteria bacterium]|nr:hypothetical protein [Candidatus Kaiserbacteria bacterium]
MDELRRMLRAEPLLHTTPTLKALNLARVSASGGSIYYGTGLRTKTALSIGLPFDVLILVLVAEYLRRTLGLKDIYHHIADTHALSNSFCTKESVDAISEEYEKLLKRIAEVVGVPLIVQRSSSFDASPEYRSLLENVHSEKGEYVKREMSDILWYRTKHNVSLKLGWLIDPSAKRMGFDERLFDTEFLSHCDTNMDFAYTVSGRTFDRKRSRVSPYVAVPGETRLLFKKGEDAQSKYEQGLNNWSNIETMGSAIGTLTAVMHLWDRVSRTHVPSHANLMDRVQAIIDTVCKE